MEIGHTKAAILRDPSKTFCQEILQQIIQIIGGHRPVRERRENAGSPRRLPNREREYLNRLTTARLPG